MTKQGSTNGLQELIVNLNVLVLIKLNYVTNKKEMQLRCYTFLTNCLLVLAPSIHVQIYLLHLLNWIFYQLHVIEIIDRDIIHQWLPLEVLVLSFRSFYCYFLWGVGSSTIGVVREDSGQPNHGFLEKDTAWFGLIDS
jgi:hypothetical protein